MILTLLMIIQQQATVIDFAGALIQEQAEQLAMVDGLIADMEGDLDGLETELDTIEAEIMGG